MLFISTLLDYLDYSSFLFATVVVILSFGCSVLSEREKESEGTVRLPLFTSSGIVKWLL